MMDDDRRARLERADALTVGGDARDGRASLRIHADDLDPRALTTLLECEPTEARRKGEPRDGRPCARPAPTGRWILDALAAGSLEQRVLHLLEQTSSDPEVWERVGRTHDVVLWCSVQLHAWNEELQLSAPTLARVAKRGWDLQLDLYGAEGAEVVAAFLNRGVGTDDRDSDSRSEP